MAQGRRLTDNQVRQVQTLLDAGVDQTLAADVVGISRRSVCRVVARRREASQELSAVELCSALPSLAEVLAEPPRSTRGARRRPGWMVSAGRLDRLEAERLDDHHAP
jgi:hypothetical protein